MAVLMRSDGETRCGRLCLLRYGRIDAQHCLKCDILHMPISFESHCGSYSASAHMRVRCKIMESERSEP